MFQILNAINYLHENNIVHRDIKAENFLFYNSNPHDDIIKLCDFGTAIEIDRPNNEKLSEHFGSPYYIAPEVIKGEYNQKCDIWSAGVIMFIMLMKRVPYDGDGDQEVIERVVKNNINFHHREFQYKSLESVDLMR